MAKVRPQKARKRISGQGMAKTAQVVAALPQLQLEALELRKLGHSYQEIATAQGVSISTAHGRVHSALAEIRAVVAQEAEAVREIEDARLDLIVRRLAETVRTGDPDQATRAAGQLIRASESRRKLWGLDLAPPARTEDAAPPGAPSEELDPAHLTDAQLAALEDILRASAPHAG